MKKNWYVHIQISINNEETRNVIVQLNTFVNDLMDIQSIGSMFDNIEEKKDNSENILEHTKNNLQYIWNRFHSAIKSTSTKLEETKCNEDNNNPSSDQQIMEFDFEYFMNERLSTIMSIEYIPNVKDIINCNILNIKYKHRYQTHFETYDSDPFQNIEEDGLKFKIINFISYNDYNILNPKWSYMLSGVSAIIYIIFY
jgi:hypothetical protein